MMNCKINTIIEFLAISKQIEIAKFSKYVLALFTFLGNTIYVII